MTKQCWFKGEIDLYHKYTMMDTFSHPLGVNFDNFHFPYRKLYFYLLIQSQLRRKADHDVIRTFMNGFLEKLFFLCIEARKKFMSDQLTSGYFFYDTCNNCFVELF